MNRDCHGDCYSIKGERLYVMLLSHQQVIDEKHELDQKLAILRQFCFGEGNFFAALDPIDRDLLEDQYTAMQQYSMVLEKRIQRFS